MPERRTPHDPQVTSRHVAEAALAAHQLVSAVVRPTNGRPRIELACSCKRLTLQLGIDKDAYLLHLIEAARTVTAEQREAAVWALIADDGTRGDGDPSEEHREERERDVKIVLRALGLTVEGEAC